MTARKPISATLRREVLIEAGYRCAVPTCRSILAIDLHHIQEVENGGGNTISNLIALCPTCHALFHRGTIDREAIRSWKSMLVALSHAFDEETIDRLLFLALCPRDYLVVSGDGLLQFSRMIAANLAEVDQKANNAWQIVTYAVNISAHGSRVVDAWKAGDRDALEGALGERSAG